VLDADVVINIAKLKTHNLTLYTGAIKNMFGAVPSFDKSKYHFKAHRPHHFAESIVDIYEITKPQLNIMDAVYGMEGKGPANGEKRYMGAILSSFDGVALDAVCASAIGYKPFQIDTTSVAHKRGLGKGKLEEIEITGTPLAEITKKDWKLAGNGYYITKHIPDFIFSLLKPITNQLRIDPEIIQEKCTKCLVCVKVCPTQTINYSNNKVKIDLKNCIMCYCCHELCRYNAIKLKRRWLVKLAGIGTDE
jgi:ferredoxin